MTVDLDTCPTRKLRFADGETARRHRAAVLAERRSGRRGRVSKVERTVYYCKLCGGWHLSSQRTKRK